MEPITLGGVLILAFCIYLELEHVIMPIVNFFRKSSLFAHLFAPQQPQRTDYGRKMPICLAKM